MNKTIIAWTDVTWNPTPGCSHVSDGCRNCYAETLSLRRGWTKAPWTANHAAENVQLKPHKLNEPRRRTQASRIFVDSTSDAFHPLVPDDYLRQMWQVMLDCPQHTFQILSKRPERAALWPGPWAPNIWMGTSVEDARVVHRIATLRQCGAQTRFLSCEPLLGPLGAIDLAGIHWLICGGESGPGFRPMDHAWARELRDGCAAQGVPFFFKQSAAFRTETGTALREEDGSRWEYRQYPPNVVTPPIRVL